METIKCKGCDTQVTYKSPCQPYGFCGWVCMEATKPEAFANDDTDHNAVIPEQETRFAFTARLIGKLTK